MNLDEDFPIDPALQAWNDERHQLGRTLARAETPAQKREFLVAFESPPKSYTPEQMAAAHEKWDKRQVAEHEAAGPSCEGVFLSRFEVEANSDEHLVYLIRYRLNRLMAEKKARGAS